VYVHVCSCQGRDIGIHTYWNGFVRTHTHSCKDEYRHIDIYIYSRCHYISYYIPVKNLIHVIYIYITMYCIWYVYIYIYEYARSGYVRMKSIYVGLRSRQQDLASVCLGFLFWVWVDGRLECLRFHRVCHFDKSKSMSFSKDFSVVDRWVAF